MKILSEKTNKYYATVDECLAAEKAFDEAAAKKKAEEEKLNATRKERANEVENAYKASIEANKHYRELLDAFIKDYGSFHMTVHTGNLNPFDSFSHFFDTFF
jgi:hypothetical protein